MVFLVFIDDRKMRIEVGYGLEATLTDAVASSILRDVVAPRLREGRIADGIGAGLDAIDQAIAGGYQRPAPAASPRSFPIDYVALVMLLVVVVGLGVAVIPPLFFYSAARRHGWTGGRSGWGGPFIGGSGSSGGGAGGGFSGGGGSFGGGGASGSW